MLNSSEIPALDARLASYSAADRLRWAAETFGSRAGIGTSFQPAGIVIMHLAQSHCLKLPAFTLNTGLLFPETLELKAKLEKHLGITIEDVTPAVPYVVGALNGDVDNYADLKAAADLQIAGEIIR